MSTQSSEPQHEIDWDAVRATAGPYPIEAFIFVNEGLRHTSHQMHGDPTDLPDFQRHVSGQELCMGLRDFAIEQYGLLAPLVLAHWEIRRTDDFGRIVFAMVDHKLLSKTPDDSLEDFRGIFDFDEAFSQDELVSRLGSV